MNSRNEFFKHWLPACSKFNIATTEWPAVCLARSIRSQHAGLYAEGIGRLLMLVEGTCWRKVERVDSDMRVMQYKLLAVIGSGPFRKNGELMVNGP